MYFTPEHFTSQQRLDDGTVERAFILGEIPGLLWTPAAGTAAESVPLILLGHPGGQDRMYPRLVARAQAAASLGFASATIELPGSGDRPRLIAVEEARADLRQAIQAGERPSEEVIERLILPLVEAAVPEWQAALDALLSLPEIGGPVGISGGVLAIGIRLALVEPRIAAAGLFDAFGSAEKTLQANMGGHTGVPSFAGEDAARFFARHLRPSVRAA